MGNKELQQAFDVLVERIVNAHTNTDIVQQLDVYNFSDELNKIVEIVKRNY